MSSYRLRLAALLPVGLLLPGCPIYGRTQCDTIADCGLGYRCVASRCVVNPRPQLPVACGRPDACLIGETCSSAGRCRSGSCAVHGCVAGYECGVVDGVFACVSRAAPMDASAGPVGDARVSRDADTAADARFPDGNALVDASRDPTPVEDASRALDASGTLDSPAARNSSDAAQQSRLDATTTPDQ